MAECPTPSSPETCSCLYQQKFYNRPEVSPLLIQLSVLLATTFLILKFVHGAIRRRVPLRCAATLMDSVHILTPLLIIYIIGLTYTVASLYELFPVWAVLAVYLYGGLGATTAHRLRDNDQVRAYYLHMLPLLIWCASLADPLLTEPNKLVELVILWLMGLVNRVETQSSMALASRSKGLPILLGPVIQFLHQTDDIRGGRYYLYQYNELTITTDDVWRSIDESDSLNEGLKGMTLSCAWFWLLLRRFAGFASHEMGNQSARDFVSTGLLSTEPAQVDRLFGILEVELGLLYDFFYTKYFYLAAKPSRYKLGRLLGVPLLLWFSFLTLYHHDSHGHSLEIRVTRVVMVVLALLEICHLSMIFLSDWKIVFLLCQHVRNPNSYGLFISHETLC